MWRIVGPTAAPRIGWLPSPMTILWHERCRIAAARRCGVVAAAQCMPWPSALFCISNLCAAFMFVILRRASACASAMTAPLPLLWLATPSSLNLPVM